MLFAEFPVVLVYAGQDSSAPVEWITVGGFTATPGTP
jgi:hypothetical protein